MGQKTEFLRALADWIELTPQTGSALSDYYFSCPYCAHRRLTEAYQYVITARLQSYPVERRFSHRGKLLAVGFLTM